MENHVLYITIIVMLGGLLMIAVYWLAVCDNVIKELAETLLKSGRRIEATVEVIADLRARIRELEAEIGRRESNIIELPGSRQTRSCRKPRQF